MANNFKGHDKDELIKAQLIMYPQSTILTPSEVLDWCAQPGRYNKYLSVALSIEYPPGIWYTFDKENKTVKGYRYGVRSYEYLSGFTY